MTYTVKRNGRTWDVVDAQGQVIEGGFFRRDAAQRAADFYTAEGSSASTAHVW